MNALYLKKRSITGTVFVCLSLSLTGCTSLPKSYDEPNSKRLSDNVILPPHLGIELKDNSQNISTSEQHRKTSSPAELFTYAPALSMREINFFLKGKYVIKDNCLYFVQNDDKYLSPIFYPDRAILFENENSISLKGTKVKLGEEVLTSGKIKDRIGSYFLQKGDAVIEDTENTACLTEPAVFMSGRVVNPQI